MIYLSYTSPFLHGQAIFNKDYGFEIIAPVQKSGAYNL